MWVRAFFTTGLFLAGLAAQDPASAPPGGFRKADPSPSGDLTVTTGSKIALSLINSVSTKHSHEGDRVYLDTVFPVVVNSKIVIPVGSSVVGVRFRRTGKGADATLVVDGGPSGSLAVPFAMTMYSSVGPSIGYDHGSPVSERYTGHFPFEGRLQRLDVALLGPGPGDGTAAAAGEERSAMARQ